MAILEWHWQSSVAASVVLNVKKIMHAFWGFLKVLRILENAQIPKKSRTCI